MHNNRYAKRTAVLWFLHNVPKQHPFQGTICVHPTLAIIGLQILLGRIPYAR